MKKLFTIFCFIALSLWCQAKVYYLLPGSTDKTSTNLTASEVQDFLPSESYGWGDMKPEKNAYDWFTTTYNGGTQRVVTIKDLVDGRLNPTGDLFSSVQVIWINVDRQSSSDLSALGFSDGVKTALANYVKAGGSLLLTTYATQLASQIGRYPWEVETLNVNEYKQETVTWGVNAILGKGLSESSKRDRRNHPLYEGLRTTTIEGEAYPLLSAACRSDRNCFWNDYLNPQGTKYGENADVTMLERWEAEYDAEALGTWTQIGDYCLPAIIDFKPNDVWNGEILAIGIAAYQWGTSNINGNTDASYNMKKMTENAFNHMDYDNMEVTWTTAPTNGIIGSTSTCAAACEGATSYSYTSSNSDIASVDESTGVISYNYVGEVTITANAYNGNKRIGKTSSTITISSGNANKQYLYLLHTSLNKVVENSENKAEQPEINAVRWFQQTYSSKGSLIDMASIPTSAAKDKVLWIHVDRLMSEADFDNLFPTDVRNNIKSFVQNGGNLYLTGFAPRLVYLIGRMNEAPSTVNWNNNFGGSTDTWFVTANINGVGDRHEHPVYAQMDEDSYEDYHYKMQHSDNGRRSDRNCLKTNNISSAEVLSWEMSNNALTLGSWGHTQDMASVGLVEFKPQGDFKGIIIANGLAACSFATSNDYKNHVQNLTKGVLDYLCPNNCGTCFPVTF